MSISLHWSLVGTLTGRLGTGISNLILQGVGTKEQSTMGSVRSITQKSRVLALGNDITGSEQRSGEQE